MEATRPYLVLGVDLKAFLGSEKAAAKQPMRIGLFHCLSCKEARPPAFAIADYYPKSESHGRLAAFCEACGAPCSRIVSVSDLPRWREDCEIGGEHGR